ncbi:MAG: thioredoxin domain-containing protein [Myxococcota bacterium]
MDRLRWASLIIIALVVTTGATCNRNSGVDASKDNASASSSAAAGPVVELPGISTEKLTGREKSLWSEQVSTLLSPCPEVAVPLAQCVKEARDCAACKPAAHLLRVAVEAGLPKEKLPELYKARFDTKTVKTIVYGESPHKGPTDAPITIVEFADYECPFCGQAYPVIEDIHKRFPKHVQVVFKHYPLEMHPNAKLASKAAWAAQQQKSFWKMHKLLFSNQRRLTEPDLMGYAKQIGLDLDKFQKDMQSAEAAEAVEKDLAQGKSLGVSSTPSIYVNGRDVPLELVPKGLAGVVDWVELELKLKGVSPDATQPARNDKTDKADTDAKPPADDTANPQNPEAAPATTAAP